MDQTLISVSALGLAALSLGWNIYRDVVSRTSRIKVYGMIASIVSAGDKLPPEGPPRRIVISVVNHGPADTTLSAFDLRLRRTSFREKQQHATVLAAYTNPLSAQLPLDLKVGKKADFIFPFNSGCFLNLDLSHIGISDVFGRTHWMKARFVGKLRSGWCKEFQPRA